jgi:uncharacterized protein
MSAPLPEHIDILRLAKQGCKLSGRLFLDEMPRLKEYATAVESDNDVTNFVDIEVELDVDDQHIAFIRGSAQASVAMICQRCLKPMKATVNASFLLGAVENEAKLERLPAQYEPLEISEKLVSLSGIIEDELILALPLVALHDQDQCTVKMASSQQVKEEKERIEAEAKERNNPFSILSALKKD